MTDGTRIAGLTAPKQNPFAKLRLQGISNMKWERIATLEASAN